MKKTTIISVMAVLWPKAHKVKIASSKDQRLNLKLRFMLSLLLTFLGTTVFAQNAGIKTQEIVALKLGQKIPSYSYHQKFPILNINSKTVDSITLNQYKGKLVLLDFWASWCSNCIYKFELLGKLQAQYQNDLQIILVNSKNTKDTPKKMLGILSGEKAPFIKSHLTTIYNNEILNKLFPHSYLPHYVWIGAQGEVLAITGAEMVNEHAVEQYLKGIARRSQRAQVELSNKR